MEKRFPFRRIGTDFVWFLNASNSGKNDPTVCTIAGFTSKKPVVGTHPGYIPRANPGGNLLKFRRCPLRAPAVAKAMAGWSAEALAKVGG